MTPNPSTQPRDSLQKLLTRFRFDLAFFHWLKPYLPRGLYGRALLILVLPVIVAQALAVTIFYERHWQTVANRLTYAVAGEIAVVSEKMSQGDPMTALADLQDLMEKSLYLTMTYHPDRRIGDYPARGDYASIVGKVLLQALREKIARPFALDLRHAHEEIAVNVELPHGVLSVVFPERRVYSPTALIFIIWMIGSSLLMSLIAILFLRNQIRPIRRLAKAAEMMGKGQDTPDFKAEGAKEVRQAAINLLIMRDRLKRQVAQRTTMLNGVSHDLRTPLTRMTLQLALMPDNADIKGLKDDVHEMTQMIEAYLAFAKGEDGQETIPIESDNLLEDIVNTAKRTPMNIHLSLNHQAVLRIRITAIKRALNNLIGNAARYGHEVWVSTDMGKKFFDIIIDDNGPGIPANMRDDVFKPFMRLEESRNSQTGGIGLGLTIARDIAHQHGGDVILVDSPKGGLRAILRLPL